MSTYIAMGSVYQFYIEKKYLKKSLSRLWIENKTDKEIRDELSKNFPPDLYKCTETEDWFHYCLSNEIPVSDFIELYDEFNKLIKSGNNALRHIDKIRKELCCMSSINEVYEYADDSRIGFWPIDLPYYYYYYRISMFGQTIFTATAVDGSALYIGDSKIICEDSALTFDLFTDFLQSCLKHTKLGRTMLVCRLTSKIEHTLPYKN